MTKRIIILSVLLTVLLALGSSVLAATVDIVPYMGLQPGKWSIMKNTESLSQQGYHTVKGTSGRILRNWYNNDGSGWSFDCTDVFKITSTTLRMIGQNDGTDLWIFEPVLTIPRKLSLNEPVYYDGILRNQRTQATQKFTILFMITKTGLTVSTQAGTFKNCIKFRSYHYSAGISRDATSLLAPGRNDVKQWRCKIKDTTDPVEESQVVSIHEVIQFGDSDPPIP